ncbi:MAG: MFS transporter [Burkholderiaceae bacterium]|jgi:MFS family permease|nr:MFS transporter [Burkholderiaceae bacterium]
MNRNRWLLALCQGLFLTNNIGFTAINGLVGLSMAPLGWMATLPIMGYVVGGALATGPVTRAQLRFGRRASFQIGLAVALGSTLLCALAVALHSFWLLCAATVVAGYYNANAQLYRFAAAEVVSPQWREKAVSLVMAGGLIGAVIGPNLARYTRDALPVPFAGVYLALAVAALAGMALMQFVVFPAPPPRQAAQAEARPLAVIVRQPAFITATLACALGYGVMNLLMAATPLAMQVCGLPFADTALVLEWHVIGMFAPGFVTGHLIRRLGAPAIMSAGLLFNLACIMIALAGLDVRHFAVALFLLGVGWNFLFTGGTTLALTTFTSEEKDRAQGALNFWVFAVQAVSTFSSGALVTTKGWRLLNFGSLVPVALMGLALLWLAATRHAARASKAGRCTISK